MSLTRFTVRAPKGWHLDHSFGAEIVFAADRHLADQFAFSDTSIYPGTSLGQAERIVSRNDDWTRTPHSGPRVTLDGQAFFHLSGPAGHGRWYDVYGYPDRGRLVQLAFRAEEPQGRRDRLVASVLATVHLR